MGPRLPLRVLRLANPLVARVLRSPAHGLVSGSLLLLEYRGHRTGSTFRIPLQYAYDGDRVVTIALRPEHKLWWRTFRDGAPARLLLEGRILDVHGRLLREAEAAGGIAALRRRFPRRFRALGLSHGTPEDGAAVVGFDERAEVSGGPG